MAENRQQKKLTAKQKRALAALLAGMTQEDAAAAAGVAYSTIRRWLDDPVFGGELERQSSAAVMDAARRLTGAMQTAIDVFDDMMTSPESSPALKLRAANYTVQHGLKLLEVAEILTRLDAIESSLGIAS